MPRHPLAWPVMVLALACATPAPPVRKAPPSAPPSQTWLSVLGEYAHAADTLSLLEDAGRPALQRWGGERLALTERDDSTLVAASGDTVRLARDAHGRVSALRWRGDRLARLAWGPANGNVFRITPRRPVAALRKESRRASPPIEEGDFLPTDLVDLVRLDSTIRLDIRYAGPDNFMGVPLYSSARAFLQRPAAEALVRAHRALAAQGYGLLIHDGYRPWYVTRMFWEATPDSLRLFVANPAKGSRHNRGCAVDLTLYDLGTGAPVAMPGVYDEMSPRSFPTYPGGTTRQRALRDTLRAAMEAEGFRVHEAEWWHFDFRGWERYRIGNQAFEAIGS